MKVALLSFEFGEYCLKLATALDQEAEVVLLIPQYLVAPYSSTLVRAINMQTFTKPRLRQPWRQVRMLSQLLRHLQRFDPDVIHLQQGHLWFNFALPLLRRYPLVLTIHDPRHHPGDQDSQKTPQRVMDYGFRQASQVIVHGEQLKKVVINECRIPGELIHVIPHIVIGDDTSQSEIQEHGNLVLFFGRIWGYKGLEYLIRAEPLITAQVPDVEIVIAGQGEDFTRYHRMMVHPERFTVHNTYISEDKRAELFRRASVAVLPYTEASQSGVIPIAYTFAKPVVATTVGSLPEMVEDGQTGYLVPPRDEKALAEAVVRLLLDKKLRHRLGENGKRKIATECSAEVVAQKTLDVYICALNSTRTRKKKRRAIKPWSLIASLR